MSRKIRESIRSKIDLEKKIAKNWETFANLEILIFDEEIWLYSAWQHSYIDEYIY